MLSSDTQEKIALITHQDHVRSPNTNHMIYMTPEITLAHLLYLKIKIGRDELNLKGKSLNVW